ncbi:TlpA family protein disulfide reductase [Micromonospora globbae]|uniref:TlpA family protein disulfide reductase n=1 Tax=Micromonospora globbae TaxID=1894969 RepID=A0ABZ1S2B9_9ACTN|nr:TlpA disulfide reductase family protein [Micromonospora globbae]
MASLARGALTCATVTSLLLSLGCTGASPRPGSDVEGVRVYEPAARSDAPAITGQTLSGQMVRPDDLTGKVVVLNFWASWCAPCRLETPDLVEVAHESHDQGVEFVGVNVQDASEKAEAFVSAYGIPYENIFDPAGRVAMSFSGDAPNSIPATVVIDSTGRVASVHNGPIRREALLAVIKHVK